MRGNFTNLLARYQSIIPDIKSLEVCLQQPLPLCFWTNQLKSKDDQLLTFLEEIGVDCKPMAWTPSAFKCNSEVRLGKSWLYLTGLLHIQEEVSMLPAYILQPQPEDLVIDLCAAPGNKTAQMAMMMANQGMMVANDNRYQRMKAMGQIIRRLGLLNVSVTVNDGRTLPCQDGVFDKVMVDVPCSCEGTLRKSVNKIITPDLANSRRMAQLQYALLKKAVQLVKPGGTLTYSTCTFAPEENEAVVDSVLQHFKSELMVRPIVLDNFNYSPGITQWQGCSYADQLKHTIRVWPHQNNSGGFFVAHLYKKSGAVYIDNTHAFTERKIPQDVSHYLTELHNRFQFSPWNVACYYSVRSKRGIYIAAVTNDPEGITGLNKLQFDSVGLFFMKTQIRFPKLSTAAAMLLGHKARINRIELTAKQRDLYLTQQSIDVLEQQMNDCKTTGYALVYYKSHCLGVALLFVRDDRGAVLRSLFPYNIGSLGGT